MVQNILYISYDGMTDPLGRSQVLPYLTGLARYGYRFHLISFEKKDAWLAGRETVEKITAEAGIAWYPLTYTASPPVLSTLYDLKRMQSAAEKILKSHPVKAVHCRSYISALTGLRLKKKYGVKFIFDMRGFWADERIEGGI